MPKSVYQVTSKKYPTHNQNLRCQFLLSDDYGLSKQKGERFFAPTARTKIQEPNLKQRPRAASKTMDSVVPWFNSGMFKGAPVGAKNLSPFSALLHSQNGLLPPSVNGPQLPGFPQF